jgi:hypothetical protein
MPHPHSPAAHSLAPDLHWNSWFQATTTQAMDVYPQKSELRGRIDPNFFKELA